MIGAGEGNRTLVCSLGSCRSTIELRPRADLVASREKSAMNTGRTDSPSYLLVSTRDLIRKAELPFEAKL
jgi:hypothetical protein